MVSVRQLCLKLVAPAPWEDARLWIGLLPRAQESNQLRATDFNEQSGDATDIRLLEGCEYLFEWRGLPDQLAELITEPREIFQPDTLDGRRGRLRPGLHVGAMPISLMTANQLIGRAEIEIQSRKLSYESEYQWMLEDITAQVSEMLMNRFAASEVTFGVDEKRDPLTLYQRFAFLRGLIDSESFHLALGQVTRNPHVAWVERTEEVPPGRAVRASASLSKQISRAGPRRPWPAGLAPSLPETLFVSRTEATHDTPPNRFVKFALERWLQVLARIEERLAEERDNPAIQRGRREVTAMVARLEEILKEELFRDLGPLHRFPADDQTLQRREGYREVLRAYLEFELGSRLRWRGQESIFRAGQRDVARLYEYWAFLQLVEAVAEITGETFDVSNLLDLAGDQLNLQLETGRESIIRGMVTRLGRRLSVELCFNRTFRRDASGTGSWSRPMRPDYSMILSSTEDEASIFEPVILHFDAKYKIDSLKDLFGEDEFPVNEGLDDGPVQERAPLRGDLLKMHAYRDAIRRSAGAYVIYPGDEGAAEESRYTEYHEILPGLGAFALRPSGSGEQAYGLPTLRGFLEDVIDHVARRFTRHERGRFWLEEAYSKYDVAQPIGMAPGPKTSVLLGFVKSKDHWNWIHAQKTYNVRAEGRSGGQNKTAQLLYSQLLLLYCPETESAELYRILSHPELMNEAAMRGTGYPNPTGSYLCVRVSWFANQSCIQHIQPRSVDQFIQETQTERGMPTAISWEDLGRIGSR